MTLVTPAKRSRPEDDMFNATTPHQGFKDVSALRDMPGELCDAIYSHVLPQNRKYLTTPAGKQIAEELHEGEFQHVQFLGSLTGKYVYDYSIKRSTNQWPRSP